MILAYINKKKSRENSGTFLLILPHLNSLEISRCQCAELAWFPPYNLPENTIPRHRHIIEMIQQNILYSESSW